LLSWLIGIGVISKQAVICWIAEIFDFNLATNAVKPFFAAMIGNNCLFLTIPNGSLFGFNLMRRRSSRHKKTALVRRFKDFDLIVLD